MDELGSRAWFQVYGGLACALGVIVCGLAAVALDAPQPLRAIAAGALILWAPGFALTMASFAPGAIGGVERAVLSCATSVAVTVIPAILLEASGVQLETVTFLITGCVVTALGVLLALLRLPPHADLLASLPAGRPPGVPIATVIDISLTAISVTLILVIALAIARITPQPAGIHGSSAFAVTSAKPGSIRAEVISAELEATSYRLRMQTSTGSVELARFTLRPGGSWRKLLRRPAGSDGVELFLYRGASRGAYRRVVVAAAQSEHIG